MVARGKAVFCADNGAMGASWAVGMDTFLLVESWLRTAQDLPATAASSGP